MANDHDKCRVLKIKGFPGYELEINDETLAVRIWNTNATIHNKDGKRRETGQTRRGRYWIVWLIKPGAKRGKGFYVHKLVCEAVYGEPKEYQASNGTRMLQEVCHGRLGALNNHPSNLRWGTRAENAGDMVKDGGVARGEKHGRAKLSEGAVRVIRKRADAGESLADLAREYTTPVTNVRLIVLRKAWKHVI